MSLIGPLKPLLTNLVMPPAGPLLLILLGGGVKLKAPEYGEPILANDAHMRLRYGIHLARQTGSIGGQVILLTSQSLTNPPTP